MAEPLLIFEHEKQLDALPNGPNIRFDDYSNLGLGLYSASFVSS